MYLVFITAGLCVSYFILYGLFPFFFTGRLIRMSWKSAFSLALIVLLSFAGYAVVVSIRDLELGNRILHIFGGGFISFLICLRVVKDSRLPITKFQFFIFSALVVTGMGVGNEILEFFLQNSGVRVFLRTPNDTWLDLISNTIGILIGAACFVPFAGKKAEEKALPEQGL